MTLLVIRSQEARRFIHTAGGHAGLYLICKFHANLHISCTFARLASLVFFWKYVCNLLKKPWHYNEYLCHPLYIWQRLHIWRLIYVSSLVFDPRHTWWAIINHEQFLMSINHTSALMHISYWSDSLCLFYVDAIRHDQLWWLTKTAGWRWGCRWGPHLRTVYSVRAWANYKYSQIPNPMN